MPTTKRDAGAATKSSAGTLNLDSIVLASIKSERNFDPQPDGTDTGNATIAMYVEPAEGFLTARITVCSVEFKDSRGGVVLSIESKFRADFRLDDQSDVGGVQDHISGLALRVTYPYHRQIISNVAAQGGLPGVVLPLVANEDLENLAVTASARAQPSEG